MNRLPDRTIYELYEAAVDAGLTQRSVLVSSLPRPFVASLPVLPAPSAQLLSDLNHLNAVGRLSDGSLPIRDWLVMALALAGPKPAATRFREALTELGEEPPAPRTRPGPPPEARIALEEFFLVAFSAAELRRLLRYLPDGNVYEANLPDGIASLTEVARIAVDLLVQHGGIDAGLFDRIAAVRPRRIAEVNQLRRLFGA